MMRESSYRLSRETKSRPSKSGQMLVHLNNYGNSLQYAKAKCVVVLSIQEFILTPFLQFLQLVCRKT